MGPVKLTLALLLLPLLVHSNQASDAAPRLTGGTITVPGQFPSAVSIETPYFPQNCVGTVVNHQHVLTAASCVMNPTTFGMVNPFWLRVTAGDISLLHPTVRREVRNVTHCYVHPNYNRLTDNNDLAVLRLNVPFPEFHNTIEPAILNDRMLPVGTVCQYAGWGATVDNVNAAIRPELYYITVPTLQAEQCNVAAAHAGRVQATMVCAGQVAANPNTVCHGNRGGGLYCNGKLTGVLTFGFTCGLANRPGVYADVRQYATWINAQFARTDNPQPGWLPPQPT